MAANPEHLLAETISAENSVQVVRQQLVFEYVQQRALSPSDNAITAIARKFNATPAPPLSGLVYVCVWFFFVIFYDIRVQRIIVFCNTVFCITVFCFHFLPEFLAAAYGWLSRLFRHNVLT